MKDHLNNFKKTNDIDLVIANGENAAGGAGITAKTANEILGSGVDAITLGDHVWDQMSFNNEIETLESVCRPANLPDSNPGRDRLMIEKGGFKIGIFTVLGRSFMGPKVSCPFQTASSLVEEMKNNVDAIVVEIHAETTSEKEAMGWHLDGLVSIVFGTHTHVPTSDGRILKDGTAYQTDLGMTGPRESVLGREINACLSRFIDGMPRKCPVASEDVGMQGCLIKLDCKSGFPNSIERIDYRLGA